MGAAAGCSWLLALALCGPGVAARPLSVGFVDGVYLADDAAIREAWLERSRRAGATVVRISLTWSAVAPTQPPPGFVASDPADPAYRWDRVDAAVRDAAAKGLEVILTFGDAPAWAEGAGGRGDGNWRPEPAALADFAMAAAARYSGTFPDPTGSPLPRVRRWQIWNEPNLATYLAPQGARGAPGPSAAHYRAMLNAAYEAIKAVQADSVVATAGTAPYGDRTGRRTSPVRFWRALLCLRGRRLARAPCQEPARFDAWAHHPYSIASPGRRALGAADVAIADMWKLTRIVNTAVRAGRSVPRGSKRLWITEISWDSKPPDPNGVPAATHARWLAESFFRLWRAGADTITWFQVRDEAPNGGFGASVQSGVYLSNGRPKRALQAFRFPFYATGRREGSVGLWAKSPHPGSVIFEAHRNGRWRELGRARTGRSNLAIRAVRVSTPVQLRARVGGTTSLSVRVR